MSKQEGIDQQRFDAVLRKLLEQPPQPRPAKGRSKGKPTRKIVKRASAERHAPSA